MKQEIAIKWAEALRSGRYEQGKEALHPTETQFCCLGVLCDLLGAKWERTGDGDQVNYFVLPEYDSQAMVLPPELIEKAAMKSKSGYITSSGKELSALNDEGYSFETIASAIEEY